MFSKEQLQQRIQQISTEMATLKGQYAKLEGHLGECGHWLMELEKKEKEIQDGQVNSEDAAQTAEV